MNDYPVAEQHGSIQQIFEDAFWVTGTVELKPFIRLIRNMVILRHGDELTLINAVRLNDEGLAALVGLGDVKHVLKIGGHGMDDAFYVDRFGAQRWAVDRGESFDVELTESTELPVANARVFIFRDAAQAEAAILLERGGGLLITCDSIQHWVPHQLMSSGARLITRLMGFQHAAQIGPPWLKVQTPRGGSLESDFRRLAELPFNHLVGGHGGLLMNDAKAKLVATMTRVFG